ncbi:MAG: chemotaxis protein CheA [Candidatus Thermoplasmatota archaeon]|nr:chemotaxis protein CheA [Candidatus Thermoplasmatota archaeon]
MAKDIDMNKYSKLFVSETRESLRIMNDALLELEKSPENKELVDRIFRSAHTIKGMAGMMNFKAVVETAHAIEDVLGGIRDGRLQLKENVVEIIFSGFDTLDAMVVAVEASAEIRENPKLIQQLRGLLSGARGPATPKKKTPEIEPEPVKPKTTTVSIRLGRRCSLPSARAMVILKELGRASEIAGSSPTEADIDREHVFEELTVELEPTEKFQEALRRVIAMSDVDEVYVGMTGEPREKWHKMTKQEASAVAAPSDVLPAQTVKVGMDKLDDLLDNVGELVIGRSRLLDKAASRDDFELREISALIDKLTSDIQSKVLEIRMIPLDVVMSRFPRMVRDISKNEGKEVELLVEGGSIELDRTVVDRITEPMMHLLRNCIDHGIETTDERIHAGKKAKGLIRIVASKQQDHVLIEVSDDGRGIDYDQIRKAAVKKNVMSRGQADSASGRELLDLLFNPGFSTKSQVTEVSGRGVGLDVVKRAVEELGGSVMVASSEGAGTTFSLWLPFTLAIIEAMLVGIADQTYAVAMGTIVESHKFEKDEVKTIRGREVVQLRGEVLPLIRMREFFGMAKSPETPEGMNTLVVQSRDRRVALRVDELIGHQQIVVKGLDRRLRKVRGISGGTILGSGRIALILDVDSIIGG